MAFLRFLIADLKVEMNVKGNILRERSEKYRFDFEGEPDIIIDPEEDKLQLMREQYPTLNEEGIEYLSTGCIFYYRLLKFGGFMLHSSCIAYNGRAYIFSADSGMGKSTHTSLWQKHLKGVEMINDDKPAMRLIDGKFYAIGTPWSGKTARNSDIKVPVGALAMLGRGETSSIALGDIAKAVPFLLRQTMLPSKAENTDLLVELLDKFIRTVPIYDFKCNISEDAVKTSFEAMTGEVYKKEV